MFSWKVQMFLKFLLILVLLYDLKQISTHWQLFFSYLQKLNLALGPNLGWSIAKVISQVKQGEKRNCPSQTRWKYYGPIKQGKQGDGPSQRRWKIWWSKSNKVDSVMFQVKQVEHGDGPSQTGKTRWLFK